ncbi:hypothetical protein RVBP17_3750 [Pseudomonas phage sp. 30-3]|uniref:Uncharacterized protein n=1 Tax=Pseudomonas phage vB_PaeM_PA5oct TaxID=2163605 RepID=A0A4Y5JU11_9CAUD|nr:hypothetical protein PQE65_gp416 [Pseudomonas phage vB_PaeM_PA5oct]WMI32025.1 hypothetical protein GBBBJNDB_00334 [Pseudomonas phage Callisto]WPK39021.1 hypothetical protein Cassandra_0345 [Pseudomonas phage Cassandra]VOH55667.1 hypothetical protein MIJ3_00331 [Pseudomonas phage vB_PaeM_MIJ3]BDR26332.1 hypothetical protein RVBP17_3750 [Pseudomonas phage sp. 30-3]QCG75949.1 hypothetical protein EST35_0066 [Pseudomonas phage vB_PaeM_PA5oct]
MKNTLCLVAFLGLTVIAHTYAADSANKDVSTLTMEQDLETYLNEEFGLTGKVNCNNAVNGMFECVMHDGQKKYMFACNAEDSVCIVVSVPIKGIRL